MYQYFVTYQAGQAMPVPHFAWLAQGDTWNVYAPGSSWVTRKTPIRTPADEVKLREDLLRNVRERGFPNAGHIVISDWRLMRAPWWYRLFHPAR